MEAGASWLDRAARVVSDRFVVFACAAWAIAAAERVGQAVMAGAAYPDSRSRLMTQYFVNYIDHGFARRGLVGTLLRPLTGAVEAPEYLVFWIMVVLNLAALAGVIWCVARFLPADAGIGVVYLRAGLAIGSLGVMQIAHDLGRFDMLNLALLVGALALVLRGQVVVAGLIGTLAILIHEGFTVYGAPVLLAVAWQVQAARVGAGRATVAVLLPLAMMTAASLAVLLWGNSDAAAALPRGDGSRVWDRGLVEYKRSLAPAQLAALGAYWAALLCVLGWLYRGARRDLLFVAALFPLALNALGIDHARWLTLGFFVLLITVGVRLAQGHVPPGPGPLARAGMVLLCLPLGPMGVVDPLGWWL